MDADVELESWRDQWQSAAPVSPDWMDRVERETRQMKRHVAAEIAVTVVIGGGSLVWAALTRRVETLVLAAGVWCFIGMAWMTSMRLRRGAWVPAGATTAAFVELSILRCRRRRRAIAPQVVLYILILGFDLAWIYATRPRAGGLAAFLTSAGIAWIWPVTAALGIAAILHSLKLARELRNLMRVRQQVGDTVGNLDTGN
jgi:hypothetical protein